MSTILDVRLDAFRDPVGKLIGDDYFNITFAYDDAYLSQPNAPPLSLSLPLRGAPFSGLVARDFFANLLQERNQPLEEVMRKHMIEPNDIAGLLFHIGADCAGAVSVLPEGSPPTKVPGNPLTDYNILSDSQISEIVRALHGREPLPYGLRDPSPLTGLQSKISINVMEDGRFALPKPGSGAPTTHVLKVPDKSHLNDPQQEWLSLVLSSNIGTTTVVAFKEEIGGIPVLITERFDRAYNDQGHIIRIHQEDFAQALGLPPAFKYERRGSGRTIFNAKSIGKLLKETANPNLSRVAFLNATLFDLLIGNVDGHAKNHALLYQSHKSPNLAPRYDILPTRLDDTVTNELSYRIGAAERLAQVDFEQLAEFANQIGFEKPKAIKRFIHDALDSIVPQLAPILEVMQSMGQKKFADLIASNMRELLPKLGYPVPKEAENRDAFILRGGGWLMS